MHKQKGVGRKGDGVPAAGAEAGLPGHSRPPHQQQQQGRQCQNQEPESRRRSADGTERPVTSPVVGADVNSGSWAAQRLVSVALYPLL